MLSTVVLGQYRVLQVRLVCVLPVKCEQFTRMSVDICTGLDHCLGLALHVDAHFVGCSYLVILYCHDRPSIFGVEWHVQKLVALFFDEFVHWDVRSLQPFEQRYFRTVAEWLVQGVTGHFNVYSRIEDDTLGKQVCLAVSQSAVHQGVFAGIRMVGILHVEPLNNHVFGSQNACFTHADLAHLPENFCFLDVFNEHSVILNHKFDAESKRYGDYHWKAFRNCDYNQDYRQSDSVHESRHKLFPV